MTTMDDGTLDRLLDVARFARLPLEPGTRFARFELLEACEHGGRGRAYTAQDADGDEQVVLKLFDELGRPELVEVLQSRCAATPQDPRFLAVREVGEHNGLQFVVQPPAPGLPFQLRPPTLDGFLELLQVVDLAHEQGLSHRGLGPWGVHIDDANRPTVLDFGLAPLISEPRHDGYLAPEQLDKRFGDPGPASDVYALGALLYRQLTGRPPFEGDTETDLQFQILVQNVVPPRDLQPQIHPQVEGVCLRALSRSQSERYSSSGEMARDLSKLTARRGSKERGCLVLGLLL